MNIRRHPSDEKQLQVLEALFARRLTGLLSAGSTQLQPDIQERLRVARQQAVVRAQQVRSAAVSAQSVSHRGGVLSLGGPPSWWQRALAVLPLAVLAGGLLLVQHATQREVMLAAADVDAVLLGDSLPPAAYSDPGFTEFLRDAQP